jgi:hypothetical protein
MRTRWLALPLLVAGCSSSPMISPSTLVSLPVDASSPVHSNGGSMGDAGITTGFDAGSATPADAMPSADAESAQDATATPPDATIADAGTIDAMTPPDATSSPDAMGSPDAGMTGLDLTGTFAVQIVSAQVITTSLLGAQNTRVVTLARAEVMQSGLSAQAVVEVCGISMDPLGGETTTYPQAAIASLAHEHLSIALDGTNVGAHATTQPSAELLGWTSQTPLTDPLPTDPNDQRVTDPDHDGNPGVTLQISGFISGSLYIVNRTTIALNGTIMSADRVAGLNTTTIEQDVLGATNGLIPTGPVAAMADQDPNASTFAMVRLSLTAPNACSDIIANAGTLFP